MAIPYKEELRIGTRSELEDRLDRAVEAAVQEALKAPGRGVRVTRSGERTFTVDLTPEVPQGTVEERDLYSPLR